MNTFDHFKPRLYIGIFALSISLVFNANADVLSSTQLAKPLVQDRGQVVSQSKIPQGTLVRLTDKLKKNSRVNLIVGLNRSVQLEGNLSSAQVKQQHQAIRAQGNLLASELKGLNSQVRRQFTTVPFMALTADQATLDYLARSPLVASITEDAISKPTMASSNPVIGSPNAWAEGYDGSGWAVAVLDTGVDNTHSWFNTPVSKVVSEACYSTNQTGKAESWCPDGAISSTAVDSGLNCALSVSGCDHGTHVAGIVAGNDETGPNFGVARGADIIAMQVFSKFLTDEDCGAGQSPCTASFSSDQMAALERVLVLADSMNIAAINMSLGGAQYFDQTSCDTYNSGVKAAIDNLRSVGIATVIASGNNGWTDSIAAPGCISSAISVGATSDSDAIASFSNIYPQIHLLAPGVSIVSSVPGDSVSSKQGTSMATPHIAGAWAVMKQVNPVASVSDVLTAFQNSATLVDDSRGGGVETGMPRINLDLAIGELAPSGDLIFSDSFEVNLLPDPDLVVINAGVSNANLTPDQAFTIDATVRNQGDGASVATTLRYYLSDDNVIAVDDTPLGTDAIPGLAPATDSAQSLDTTAPAGTGTWWVGACVDAVPGESDTNNQCSTAVQIVVAALVDSDNDRLPDAAETNTGIYVDSSNTGTDPDNPDTDGDGIKDGDEVLGTLAGLDLPAMGTNPLRKDLLLEYDWFEDNNDSDKCSAHTHRPSEAVIASASAAFSNSPVTNPGVTDGVNLISDYGQGGAFTGGNLINDADGVIAGGVSGADYTAYKAANFDANRNGYFHYVLLPHRYNTTSGSSGQAEVYGDDLIVSLQCFTSNSNVANTILHEVGHNLNLLHGGNNNCNYRPNYNSVMNYKYQFPGIDNNCTPPGDGWLSAEVMKVIQNHC